MAAQRGSGTGGKVKMGRPAKPSEAVRRNRVVIMLTDAEIAKLHRLADAKELPIGTLAYKVFSEAFRRKK